MSKVNFFDKRVRDQFIEHVSVLSTIISLVLIFIDIPQDVKIATGLAFVFALAVAYVVLWCHLSTLNSIDLNIEGSVVSVKAGDIFAQDGFKVIAFNEYFDTTVDNQLIAEESLNGVFVKRFFPDSTSELDNHISSYRFDDDDFLETNGSRIVGKAEKYSLGTICVYKDYILAAFSKFDNENKARLTMPEYLGFLIKFWDKINKVYAQKSVSVPIFGSGITRIKEHRNISDEELLKIMLWTFRISEMRFKYPARLTIVIHEKKIDQVNLLDIKTARNGL